MTVEVRALRADEAPLFKELRLRALADSPDAFAQTLADARSQPDSYWANLTRSVSAPGDQIMFVAEATGRLGGMWVDPEARGRGAGRALLGAVVAWARAGGLGTLELWVTEGNSPAASLYRASGFRDTGRRDVLPSNPALRTVQMARPLGAP